MDTVFVHIFLVLNEMIEEMATQLQEKHNIEEFSHVALPVQVSTPVLWGKQTFICLCWTSTISAPHQLYRLSILSRCSIHTESRNI